MTAASASASASTSARSPPASASASPFRRLLSLASTVSLSLLLLCLQPAAVSASHFAYGTLSWEHAPTPAAPNYYLVNFEVAFRRSYGWTPRSPSAGTYFTSSDVGTIVVSQTQNAGPCCGLPTSNYCYTQNSGLPGRGCGIWSLTLPKLNILTKVTYPDDWLSGQTTGLSFSAPSHTPNTQRLTLVYTMCCRIDTLVYSAGQYTRVQADLVPPHKYSPRSTSFPRQYVVINTPVSWNVPSIHPLGWPLSYDLSTLAESSLTQQKPMGSQGTFSLNTVSGAVTWTPLRLGLMAVQFKVMAYDPDNAALGKSMVVLDTIFEVIKECTLASLNCFHNPVFDPPVPVQAIFYQGSSGTFTVTARSDDNNGVEIFTNIMPPGASINFVSTVSGKNSAGRDAKWTTYQVLWTPTLTDVPCVVCFTARDPTTQMSSSGSNCVNFVFGKGSILYLSGILRDFHSSAAYPTYLSDFNRAETSVDSARGFVATSLATNKIVPSFSGSATSTNAANFDWWFKTDDAQMINRPQVYDIVLNNATTSRPNIFTWDSGANWWPLDNQLFGNEGDSHNRFFTLEVHTYITYTGGEVLLFESSDDLWVFVDGKLPGGATWPLSGILSTQLRGTSIALDSVFTAAQKQQTFPVDIFYAHRGRTSQPQLKISLLSATLCNSIDSGLTVVDTPDLGQVTLVGAAQQPVGGKLQLMTKTPSNTGAAWFNVGSPTPGVAQPYKVSHGFDATFTFQWDGRTEGFAFVLQFDNGAAQGGQGGQLGYGGLAGIKNSIAVEFDGISLSSMGDPGWQHVSIHSRFGAANDANELSRISGSVYSAESLNLAFHNQTEHNVRIRYIPGVDNGQGGPQLGWIRVYLGIAGKEYLPVPVTSAQVDGVVLEQMWHGAAYAGFTASTSDANFANIFISNFKLVVVPPSASKSFGSRLPTVMTAGEVGSMVVQLKDVCGNVITTGNDCQALAAVVSNTDRPGLSQTLTCCSSASCGAGTIQDNGDGSYALRYNPTFANAATNPWRISVTYANDGPATALPIAGSPFKFSVEPGTTSPLLSTFAVTYSENVVEPRSGAMGSGTLGTVTITARDSYGNLQTALTDPFLVTFDPDITAGGTASAPGGALSATVKTGQSSYTTTFWTTQSRTFQLNVLLNSVRLPDSPKPIRFVAGAADALMSSASSIGLSAATAGLAATISVALRDSAGNSIQQQNAIDRTCLAGAAAADQCFLVPRTAIDGGFTTGLPTPVNVPVTCAWGGGQVLTCTYTANIAYRYALQLKINGVLMNLPALVMVSAAAVSAPNCVASFASAAVAESGKVQTLLMQLRDRFDNNVLTSTAGFATTFTPTLTGSAITPVSGTGQYVQTFTPIKAGDPAYSIEIKFGTTAIRSSPLTLKVVAGSPSSKSRTVGISPTATAGQPKTFSILSRDINDNVRTAGGEGSDYLVQLRDSDGKAYDDVATIPKTTSETYSVTWMTKRAGSYKLQSLVRETSAALEILPGSDSQGGNFDVVVDPDVTVTAKCVPGGQGILGGVIGTRATVTVLPRDQYENTQLSTRADRFQIVLTHGDSSAPIEVEMTRAPGSDKFSVEYTIPRPLAGGVTYNVNVQRLDNAAWRDLPGSPFKAMSANDAGSLFVRLSTGSDKGTIDATNNFTITELSNANAEPLTTPSGMAVAVTISSVEMAPGGVVPMLTVQPTAIAVSGALATSNDFKVTYLAQFTFPNGNPNFNIYVSRFGKNSESATGITASPFPLQLRAGAVNGANSIVSGLPLVLAAGAPVAFSITMRDLYNNVVNYDLGSAVTAELTPSASPAGKLTWTATRGGLGTFASPYVYQFSGSLPKADVYGVRVFYAGNQMGPAVAASSSTVTVRPAAPSAAKTLVQLTSTQPFSGGLLISKLVAGTPQSFTVIVRDEHSNAVDPALFPEGTTISSILSFALEDASSARPAVFAAPEYNGGGAFSVALTAFKATTGATNFPLRVMVSGALVPVDAQVRVASAQISAESYVTVPGAAVAAGSAASITLTAVDQYGNPWSGTVTAPVRVNGGASYGAVVTPSTTTAGLFAISLDGEYTTVTGRYFFELLAEGSEFLDPAAATPPVVVVVAGPVDATKTDVPSFLPPARAGENTTFTIGLRDFYGNPIFTVSPEVLASVRVNFPLDSGESPCEEASASEVQEYGDEHFSNLVVSSDASSGGGNVTISFRGVGVGKFMVNVTIGSSSIDCTRLMRLRLTVSPGPAVAANSRVVGLKDAVAGGDITLEMTLFDAFMNQLSQSGDLVLVGQPFQDDTPFSPAITPDSELWLHNTSAVEDLGRGRYKVVVRPTRSGTIQVVATVGGYLIPTYHATTGAAVEPLIAVTPNVPASWTLEKPAAIVAATPFTVTLQVTDAYGNKISQLNGRYNYSYSVRGQTLNPTDYSFGGALKFRTGGLYDWTATSALSGDVTLYISLQQEANAECAAKDAAKPYLCSNFVCESSSDACAEAARGKGTASIFVLPATCATQSDASKPWRCPDGSCQASYAACPAINMCTEAGKPVRCGVDDSCAASAEQCPCPSGQRRCASGTCVDQSRFDDLCHNVPACVAPTAHSCELNGMATGQCRADASQCPSPRVCTPGYVACADGLSCARTFAECSVLDSPVAECPPAQGTFRCPNGRCTASVTDCATPKTCAAGQVLCMADGSCAPDATQCPDQYKCAGGFICADGSCRSSADGCPSPTTCPTGWVMCENGQCSSSLSSCLGAPECPLWTVRCPSGSCVANRMLCSSQATCPNDAPVRCADNSCAKSIDFCVNPRVCPANSRVCPDGSCVAGLATCPTTTACPVSTPVLCADGVSCVANTTSCVAPPSCPVTTPMRCPDGSCRGSLIDCPSRSSCSADRPVRCADGSCVYSNQQCAVVPSCPTANPLRCPGGECVASLALCPTHVTCPLGSSRCVDGSCREDCSSALPVPCAAGQFSCPLPGVGSLCVDSQSQCPLSFICPADAPVRCLDSSCAPTVAACAPLPPKVPEVSKAPCPDGSWTTDLTTCNTPASCPTSTPFKCYDDSCRAAPADCPVPRACTTAALPYRCPNGACASSPYDSACRVTLYASCPQSAPVKCPSTSACVTDVSQCSVSKPVDVLDPSTWPAACPPQWAQCRDGSCRMSPRACDPLACPANLPFLCANGVCAKNAAGCPDPMSGCYRPQMQCESTAACVDDASDPAQCPPRSDAELLACAAQCADGFCVSSDNIRRLTSICSSHQCSLRCADGTCGFTGRATNITASTAGNLCTASATSDPIFTPLRNACPALLPYKCANGLCASSSTNCITLAQSVTCPADRPVECANSACVADSSQCPPLKPTCADGEVRCGDGTCRTGQCSDWGIGNTCPLLAAGSAVRRFRCLNGFCSATADASGCPDAQSGCPAGLSYKCLNGACIRKPGPSDDVAMLCSQYDAGKADGCPSGEFKCEGRGECVADESECFNNIGCPKDAPLRCDQPGSDSGKCVLTKGDGNCLPANNCFRCADSSCAPNDDPTQCRMLNGCSVKEPYRCANGKCAQFGTSALLRGATLSQVCLPTVLCTASQTLCYDGSCAATPALCRPAAGCADPNVLCADRSCVADASLCLTGVAGNSSSVTQATGSVALSRCPAAVPFLCDNGACVSDIASCAISNSPGAGTGTGKLGAVWQQNGQVQAAAAAVVSGGNTGGASLPTAVGRCTAEAPIECFDGSCVASFAACRQRAVRLRGDLAAATATSVNGSCPSGSIMCPNGECTLDPSGMQRAMAACQVIPACGNGMQRCADGSCVASGAECALVTDACPSFVISPLYKPLPTRRCQDGVCRYICPAYDGCPHTTAPFQCPNRECARSASECGQAARGGSFKFGDIKDSLVPPPELLTPVRRLLQATGMESSSTGAAPTPSPPSGGGSGEATVSDGTGRCYSNCASQVKAWSYSTMVDTTLNQRMVIATDVAKRDFMWMQVPAGSMKSANASLPTPPRVSISIAPVADGVVRAAENRVPSSREDVSTSGFLTHVATVLSPMFQLSVDPAVAVPFSTNFTLTAVIDTTRFGSGGAVTAEQYADICLAQLYQLEEIGYAAWRCLYHCPTGVAPNIVLGRCAVRDASSTGDASQVSGSVGEPGVYAFVLAPVAEPVPPSKLGWVQENALWLFLGLTGAVVVIFFIVYFGQRLYRYRGKMHEERAAVNEQMREVDEMEQFGGQAGTKDDEVVMMSNPLVAQLKDMQARYDQTQLALREQEAQQKAEATVVRHEHINELQADRDALAAELERLKREVDFANQSQQQGRPQAVQMSSAGASSGLVGMGAISSDSDYSVEADAADQPAPQQRADFQAQRPKKKPKDF